MYKTLVDQQVLTVGFFFLFFFTGRWPPSWCWCDPTLESSLSPRSPCRPTWRILWPCLIRCTGETKNKGDVWVRRPAGLSGGAPPLSGHTDLCPCQSWLCCPRRRPRREPAAGGRGRETLLLTAETDGPPKGDDRGVKWTFCFELLQLQEEQQEHEGGPTTEFCLDSLLVMR